MNHYPSWWDTTITLFNKYEDNQTNIVTWYKHVIPGTFWKYVGNKTTVNNVVLETKDIICRIRKSDKFKERHEWIALPNDKMSKYFTFGIGDILVRGAVNDTINEYVSGLRATDLKKKYKALQGCMEIQQWANNTGGGRGNEHYFIKGI